MKYVYSSENAFPSVCVFCARCRSLRMAASSLRSVVMSCCSTLEARTSTGTLLLLELINASPRSNRVMLRISVRVSFNVSRTYSASSGSRLRMILVLLLLMMARPYLPSSREKKSDRSWLAAIAAAP